MEDWKDTSIFLSILLTLVSIAMAFLLQAVASKDFSKSLFLWYFWWILFAIGLVLLFFAFRTPYRKKKWKMRYGKRLKRKKIGILKDDKCKFHATNLTANYWYKQIQNLNKYNVEYVSFSAINDKYIALINPYGEVYLEQNYTNLTTFNDIRNFVQNGGIFVNPGGVPFWYAWDRKRKRSTSTAREIYSYRHLLSSAQKINNQIIPIEYKADPIVDLGNYSLTDTLTYSAFKVLTTLGRPITRKAYQLREDERFCGRIAEINGNNDVVEFRAVREPLPTCYPMLRAEVNFRGKKDVIYPMVAIPDGRGLFLFAGMAFDYKNKKININKKIVDEQAKRVILSLEYMIENKTILKINQQSLFKL